MSDVIIIGGGASGMMAAIAAAENGNKVTLLERNNKTGKKIYITGKGRCNLTNLSDRDALMSNVISNPRFLFSAFSAFGPSDIMNLLEEEGCPVKTERGNRVFTVSDHASDVTNALMRKIKRLGVKVRLECNVSHIDISDGRTEGVTLTNGEKLRGSAVIIASGGKTYPSTGSDGDGYRLAREAGHTVTECYPALTCVKTSDMWCGMLEGLSLKNVGLRLSAHGRTIYDSIGEAVFTSDGISGPLALTVSSYYAELERSHEADLAELTLDMKPGLDERALDQRILRDWSEMQNKTVENALGKLLPSSMIAIMVEMADIAPDKKINVVTHEERQRLASVIKNVRLHVIGTGDFDEAVITHGGVSVREISPKTMESKIVGGLYFAGEVIDVDALTGGYNLQIAWSTGYAAGRGV